MVAGVGSPEIRNLLAFALIRVQSLTEPGIDAEFGVNLPASIFVTYERQAERSADENVAPPSVGNGKAVELTRVGLIVTPTWHAVVLPMVTAAGGEAFDNCEVNILGAVITLRATAVAGVAVCTVDVACDAAATVIATGSCGTVNNGEVVNILV